MDTVQSYGSSYFKSLQYYNNTETAGLVASSPLKWDIQLYQLKVTADLH